MALLCMAPHSQLQLPRWPLAAAALAASQLSAALHSLTVCPLWPLRDSCDCTAADSA
jgi:hypothetical protein